MFTFSNIITSNLYNSSKMNTLIKQKINDIEFKLKAPQDFSLLNDYGTVFYVIDETGSGCINFGIEKEDKKYFFKIAGAQTISAEISPYESIQLLKEAEKIYKVFKHPNLIQYIDSFEHQNLFILVFEFAEGECLFDHWNFDKYRKTKDITPMMRFKFLPIDKRLKVVNQLFSFFNAVIDQGYVAVDFYDSSIIYDFMSDTVTFCDIDLFRKCPSVNDLGEGYFGTKRLKAPEENILNAIIDEKTNCFTLSALIQDMFSEITNLKQRYERGLFIPEEFDHFELSLDVYKVLIKATDYDRDNRYISMQEFEDHFNKAIQNMQEPKY